ncbi:MAG: cytochrome c biogenesis protein CcdA, partial [Dehalococcoidia bacterium]
VFPAPDGEETAINVLDWSLPIRYTDAYVSGEVVLQPPASDIPGTTGPAESTAGSVTPALVAAPALTWPAVLAIMAGMLTALSPCLVQLAFYFTATLGGASTEGVAERGRAAAQRHVVLTGLFFALGFTLVYTAGGAAAGYVGQSLDDLGVLTRWMRPISIVAGTVIIFMAVRVAWNARAPLVCKLPMAPVFGRQRRTGLLGSALMGISFAGGCLACFSASILPALLLYAGATGSVAYGALLLGVFSLGISLPCLALAFGVSRLQPLVQRIQGAGPALGLVSAAVMAGFGFIMLTNQFHVVSGVIGGYIHTVEGLIGL